MGIPIVKSSSSIITRHRRHVHNVVLINTVTTMNGVDAMYVIVVATVTVTVAVAVVATTVVTTVELVTIQSWINGKIQKIDNIGPCHVCLVFFLNLHKTPLALIFYKLVWTKPANHKLYVPTKN